MTLPIYLGAAAFGTFLGFAIRDERRRGMGASSRKMGQPEDCDEIEESIENTLEDISETERRVMDRFQRMEELRRKLDPNSVYYIGPEARTRYQEELDKLNEEQVNDKYLLDALWRGVRGLEERLKKECEPERPSVPTPGRLPGPTPAPTPGVPRTVPAPSRSYTTPALPPPVLQPTPTPSSFQPVSPRAPTPTPTRAAPVTTRPAPVATGQYSWGGQEIAQQAQAAAAGCPPGQFPDGRGGCRGSIDYGMLQAVGGLVGGDGGGTIAPAATLAPSVMPSAVASMGRRVAVRRIGKDSFFGGSL
jgi:hypothetical protein